MRIAAIDIGTNSLHMVVCQIRPDMSFEVIDREKDMVQLGRGLHDGRLSDASMTAAIQTLSKFTRIAAARGADEVIASATSAVREAGNGGDFVEAVERALGLRIRVISGTEEARLIHFAAVNAVDLRRQPAIVIDIGGGSTEITLGTADRLMLARSFKLGVIRLAQKYGNAGPLPADDERRLTRHIRRELGTYLDVLGRRRFDRVIGTSGTILSLGALALGAAASSSAGRPNRVPARAISRLRRRLTTLTLAQRLKIHNLDPKRADLAPVGAVLIDTILDGLGAEELTLCDFALREGLIYDYIARNPRHIRTVERYPDVRRRSVIELGERCNYLADHARQIAALSLALFDATRARHGLGPREREWLEYGALLHDIGTHIGYERHQKHSYYLIRHSGLRGFEPDEVEWIALVARYHRQATPKKSHEELQGFSRSDRHAVAVLSAMVRLAEGLDRSHAQAVDGIDVTLRGRALSVKIRTRGDVDLELWAADRHGAALADALDVDLAISRIPPRRPRAPRRGQRRSRSPRQAGR